MGSRSLVETKKEHYDSGEERWILAITRKMGKYNMRSENKKAHCRRVLKSFRKTKKCTIEGEMKTRGAGRQRTSKSTNERSPQTITSTGSSDTSEDNHGESEGSENPKSPITARQQRGNKVNL